ncbi:hypothetical protein Gpo141_00012428 [Globisporangium polare]
MSAAHSLAQALRLGVFNFLPTRDVVNVLSCCKASRNDAELARTALFEGPTRRSAAHCFQGCGLDWFSLNPMRFPMGYENKAGGCHHSSTTTRSQVTAQMVSLIGAFEKLILPARPARGHAVSEYGDTVYAVPVIISLWDHHPKKSTLKTGHEWTQEDVRLALNAVDAGLGDNFVDRTPTSSRSSELGAHWSNASMTENEAAACALCADTGAYFDRGVRKLCAAYATPLKDSLLKHFKFAGRASYDLLIEDEEPWFDEFYQFKVELLAAVSASGFLCGSFCVLNESP